MTKSILRWSGAAAGVLASLALSSCYYDPNYTSTSVGASYSSGYGQGYGYGGSGFSTSVFVSTGDPQWGYDPYCYSYYDYRRRAYYDPYLNGYYPVGYRPPVVYGVPHPYGWRRGSGYIRPPVYVKNVRISNYQNRAQRYQGTSYGWAKQVRQQPVGRGRTVDSHPSRSSGGGNYSNQGGSTRKSQQPSYNRSAPKPSVSSRQDTNARGRQQSGTLPSRYNTPVRANDSPSRKAKQMNQRNSRRADDSRRKSNSGSGKANKGREEENRKSRYR